MKLLLCIVVHNRYENIERWLHIWQQCQQHGAELIVIHNYYGDNKELKKFNLLCQKYKIKYIPRIGLGYDIGALQDIFRNRLTGFPNDWTHLLWCTDDVFPMSRDFLQPFLEVIQKPYVGVACMQISQEVKTHIRTTGFMIKKEIASRITFMVDPITTKEDCYRWEHRARNTFYDQIVKMGLKAIQVAKPEVSPLWDSGYTKRVPRETELRKLWYPEITEKVLFICPVFDAYPQVISSLICQTHTDWELLLIHDGDNDLSKYITDERITYIKRPREAKWGHPHRQWALEQIKQGKLGVAAEYVVITNADNYYTPNFLKSLLGGFTNGQVAAYCDIVHSYTGWGVMQTRLQLGYLDCGGVVVRKDAAVAVGWKSFEHSSDWTYFSEIISKYGAGKWVKVRGCLFVHNVIVLMIFKLLFYAI